jgi:hypothetical protein
VADGIPLLRDRSRKRRRSSTAKRTEILPLEGTGSGGVTTSSRVRSLPISASTMRFKRRLGHSLAPCEGREARLRVRRDPRFQMYVATHRAMSLVRVAAGRLSCKSVELTHKRSTFRLGWGVPYRPPISGLGVKVPSFAGQFARNAGYGSLRWERKVWASCF